MNRADVNLILKAIFNKNFDLVNCESLLDLCWLINCESLLIMLFMQCQWLITMFYPGVLFIGEPMP